MNENELDKLRRKLTGVNGLLNMQFSLSVLSLTSCNFAVNVSIYWLHEILQSSFSFLSFYTYSSYRFTYFLLIFYFISLCVYFNICRWEVRAQGHPS